MQPRSARGFVGLHDSEGVSFPGAVEPREFSLKSDQPRSDIAVAQMVAQWWGERCSDDGRGGEFRSAILARERPLKEHEARRVRR